MSRGEAGSNYEKTGGRKSRWTVHLKGQPVDWAATNSVETIIIVVVDTFDAWQGLLQLERAIHIVLNHF